MLLSCHRWSIISSSLLVIDRSDIGLKFDGDELALDPLGIGTTWDVFQLEGKEQIEKLN